MMTCVMCFGALLGGVVGTICVLFLNMSLLAGIGIYFALSFAVTAYGIAMMLGRQQYPTDQSRQLNRQVI